MAADVTIVIPVWDQHTHLLPRCLEAIDNEAVDTELVLINNASSLLFDVPAGAHEVTLATRHTIGAARNAALPRVSTPFVVFADADDEIAPGSLGHSLTLLQHHASATGVVGRSTVDENGSYRRGRTPRTRIASSRATRPPSPPCSGWLPSNARLPQPCYAPTASVTPEASPTPTRERTGYSLRDWRDVAT